MDYMLFQLQGIENSTYVETTPVKSGMSTPLRGRKKNWKILARLSSKGNLKGYEKIISGAFLAGGSFDFDLNDEGKDTPPSPTAILATLGLSRICGGLLSVALHSTGPVFSGPVFLGKHSECST